MLIEWYFITLNYSTWMFRMHQGPQYQGVIKHVTFIFLLVLQE